MRRTYELGIPLVVYCAVTLLVALVGIQTGLNLLFWVFGIMLSTILLSGIISGAMMMRLRVRRIVASHGVAGEPLIVRYAVRNRGRLLPAFGIDLSERNVNDGNGWQHVAGPAPTWIMHIGPGETVHGEAIFRPMTRGIMQFDRVRASSTFPFGLLRKSIHVAQESHTLIFPRAFRLRPGVLSGLAPSGTMGSRISGQAGPGDDFFGLRDYRPGDSLRNIAWKRTANREGLLTVERARPNPPRVRFVLDLRIPTDELRVTDDEPRTAREFEEDAISLIASLVHAAESTGYEFGLTILGVHAAPVPVRRNAWHRDKLLAELARIDLDLPRDGANRLAPASREAAARIIVSAGRVDGDIGDMRALHLTGRQLEHLIDGPLPAGTWGMDPLIETDPVQGLPAVRGRERRARATA